MIFLSAFRSRPQSTVAVLGLSHVRVTGGSGSSLCTHDCELEAFKTFESLSHDPLAADISTRSLPQSRVAPKPWRQSRRERLPETGCAYGEPASLEQQHSIPLVPRPF